MLAETLNAMFSAPVAKSTRGDPRGGAAVQELGLAQGQGVTAPIKSVAFDR